MDAPEAGGNRDGERELMGLTSIEWANRVWNPWVGCTRVNEECDGCYAKDQAARLARMGVFPYAHGGLTRKREGKGLSRDLDWTGAFERGSARVRSEPLLEPLPALDLDGIGWVIVGGESGPGARPMEAEWVRPIRDKCLRREVPFFFKQWGGANKKRAGRLLDGEEHLAVPAELEIDP